MDDPLLPVGSPPDPTQSFSHRLALVLLLPLTVLFVALVLTLFVTHTTAYVDGPSMEPTLYDREVVLVTRGYDEPVKGDVVIIELDLSNGDTGVLVKRIVAVAGDEVEVDKGNAIINGAVERGDHTVIVGERDISVPRQVVPDGYVYVLGDNRPVSEDSRLFGPVSIDSLEGKVVAVIQPVNRARRVD